MIILIILLIIYLIISYFLSLNDKDNRFPSHHKTLEEPIRTNVKRQLPKKPVVTVPAKNWR